MKIKEYINQYHDGIKTQTDKRRDEGERTIIGLKKKLSHDEKSMTSQVSFQKTQLKIALDTNNIDQKTHDKNIVSLDEFKNSFYKTRDSLIKNQEEINNRSIERSKSIFSVQLRKQVKNDLLIECIRGNLEAGFKGMPTHVQRYIKKWEMIAIEIDDDPQRFIKTLQKEKSGVMIEPWKQYNEKRLLKIENRNLKKELLRLKNG